MYILDLSPLYGERDGLKMRSFSNCLFDFKNETFSKSLFDKQYFELSDFIFIITVDIINYSKLTEEQFNYILTKLETLKHVKHIYTDEAEYHLRPAYQDDMCNLMPIFKENSIANGGTLYCEESAPSISNNKNIFLLEYKGNRIGYVALEEKNKIHKDMTDTTLLKPVNYEETDFIYIKQCAISKEYQGKNFGMFMFEELFKHFKDYTFYSHVSVENIQSLKLHYRSGFEKIGVYSSNNFHRKSKYFSDLVRRKS